MATRKINVASTKLDSVVYSLDLVRMFRKVDPDIELVTVGIFSLIALNEGVTNSDVAEYFSINKARASRNVQILSSVARTRKSNQGLGLLHQVLDDDDFRVRKLYLTKKGKDVKNNMLKLLG
jgi:DNA-binding MarR family transcriptional regulator|tara:strand:- start:305 stop:670 length:366 start_codon:yes stop_codon:yes gene_type:complete